MAWLRAPFGWYDPTKWKPVHQCPRCGKTIDVDPNPHIDRLRHRLWRQAHKLNCGCS